MGVLTIEKLDELEHDARMSLSHKDRWQKYILIKPEDVLAMIYEIRELRQSAKMISNKQGE